MTTQEVILPEPTMQRNMAINNYNNQGYYYNYINNNSTPTMSSLCQPVSLDDVQVFLNNFYFRLINNEHKSPSQCLPVINNILSEMKNIVMFINEMDGVADHECEDLWWDNTHENDIYTNVDSDSDCSCQESFYKSTNSLSSSSSCDNSSFVSSDSNSSSSFTNLDVEMRILEDEIFIDSVLNLIDDVAPNNKFNKRRSMRKRAKKIRKLIHPLFRSMWSNSAAIMTPKTPSSRSSIPQSAPRYPVIDWSKVNERFLKNLPTPGSFPIQGCSNFGEVAKKDHSCGLAPHGYKRGYLTNLGVVAPQEDQLAHGYVSTKDGWVLHAQYPREDTQRQCRERTPFKKFKRRKKEPR